MCSDQEHDESFDEQVVEIPIEDHIDLHIFQPKDVKELLPEYFYQAVQAGFETVRVIHGKGTGVFKRITESICKNDPHVISWKTGDETSGGWGSTTVILKKRL